MTQGRASTSKSTMTTHAATRRALVASAYEVPCVLRAIRASLASRTMPISYAKRLITSTHTLAKASGHKGHAIRKAVSTTHQSLPNVGKVRHDRKSISTSVSDHIRTAQAASFPLRRSPLPALGLTSKRFLPQCLGCQQDPPHRLTQRGAGSPSTQGEADAGFSTPHRLERTGITVPAHGSPSWAGYNSGAPPHT